MAHDPTNVTIDKAKLEIDGTEDELLVEVELPESLIHTAPVTAAPTGTTVLAHLVTGLGGTLKIRGQQPTAARLLSALNVTVNSPPAVGSQLVGKVVKITPFGDGGNTRTLKFYNVVFNTKLGKLTGKVPYVFEIEGTIMRDHSTGKVWEWAVA